MRLITSTALLCAVPLILVMTSPAMADDQTPNCDPANAQNDVTITISMNSSGTGVQAPTQVCVTHDAHVKWVPANPDWKWVTLFVDDAHSPFGNGKILHGNGNDHDDITRKCPPPNPTCSYPYYGLVVIGTTPYVIDPTIIVNPNAIENLKKKKAPHK
jgi:hypothetical protein